MGCNLRFEKPELMRGDGGPPPDHVYVAAAVAQALGGSSRAGAGNTAGPATDPWGTTGPLRLWEDRP